MSDWSTDRRRIVRDAIGVALAVSLYGVSFGALATTAGLDVTQALALSTLTFTGGTQFALVSVIGAGGTAVTAIATALLLGARNALYGLRLAPILKVHGRRRLLAAHLTVDESTAMALAQTDERRSRLAFWATGTGIFVCWNIAMVVGAIGARVVGDPTRLGLDAAIPAALLALVWPQLKNRRTILVAIGAAAAALALTPLVTPGLPVLLAASVAIVMAWPERAGGDV